MITGNANVVQAPPLGRLQAPPPPPAVISDFGIVEADRPIALEEDDHSCKFWTALEFGTFEKAEKRKAEKAKKDKKHVLGGSNSPKKHRNNTDPDVPLPLYNFYLEDEDGNTILKSKFLAYGQFIHPLFENCFDWAKPRHLELAKSFNRLPLAFQEGCLNLLEEKWPVFRYCTDRWKTIKFVSKAYSEWHYNRDGGRAEAGLKKQIKREATEVPEEAGTSKQVTGAKRTNDAFTPTKLIAPKKLRQDPTLSHSTAGTTQNGEVRL